MARPAHFNTEEELQKKIDEYFKECEPEILKGVDENGNEYIMTDKHGNAVYDKKKPPTVAGLAHYLGYESRQSLYDLKKKEEFSYNIKRAVLLIEAFHEGRLGLDEKNTGSIFWAKNHGWSDRHDIEHTFNEETIKKLKEIYGYNES